MTIEPKLTGMLRIDLAQLPRVPSVTIMRPSVGDSSYLKLLANLSDITLGIAPESNEPYTASEYTNSSS